MIPRRSLAHALGLQTSSLARADRRGNGPGSPVFVSKTFAAYFEADVDRFLAARGLAWDGSGVRPLATNAAVPVLTGPQVRIQSSEAVLGERAERESRRSRVSTHARAQDEAGDDESIGAGGGQTES